MINDRSSRFSTPPESKGTIARKYRIAINGYGRIGRCFLRALYESGAREQLQVVAINELADIQTVAHLTRFDSTHGRFGFDVEHQGSQLIVNGDRIEVLNCDNLQNLPWKAIGVDLVVDCTGKYRDRNSGLTHIALGTDKVLYSQPGARDIDATLVYGFNHHTLDGSERIASAASCTSNASIPVIDCLHQCFGIESGVITTMHSAMNDQPVIDAYHDTDLRKTRSALNSMIPVDTGLARGIDFLLPELAGKFEARAMRVPVVNVSSIDLTVQLSKDVSLDEVNHCLKQAAQNYSGVLGYTEEMLASCDFIHDPRSGIIDASQTRLAGKRLLKLLIWFDNEWGYANRLLNISKELLK